MPQITWHSLSGHVGHWRKTESKGLMEEGYGQILTQVVSNTRLLHKPSSTAAALGKERSREGQMFGKAEQESRSERRYKTSPSHGTVLAE